VDLDYLAIVVLSSISSAAVLLIATLGLAVVFGLMGVINLAHGEFIMVGAFAALTASRSGLPFPLAVAAATLATAVFGIIVERVVIRRLYGRLLDTLLATWGLSLALYQTAVLIFGSVTPGIGMPSSTIAIGRYTLSSYFLFLIGVAIALLLGTYLLLTRTHYGIMARAAVQDGETAAAMGIETGHLNTMTFALGSGLAGFAGAILLPAFPATPGMGFAFVTKAFLAVVAAGPVTVTGTALTGGALGAAASLTASFSATVFGDFVFFVGTLLILWWWPNGISDRWRRKL
jgi:urea transport system permease protein